MKNEKKSNTELKVALIAGIFTLLVAIVSILPSFLDRSKEPLTIEENPESMLKDHEAAQIEEQEKLKGRSEVFAKPNIALEKNTSLKVEIKKTIKYQGRILQNAYFEVNGYRSSLTGLDGIATIEVPNHITKDGKEYDFNVFVSDTLLYSRSMRFSQLEFNSY